MGLGPTRRRHRLLPESLGVQELKRCPVYKVGSSPSVSSIWNMVNHTVPRRLSFRDSDPQGKPVHEVAEEFGESEGLPVMGRIAVEAQADITARESAQTSGWSFVARRTRELRTRES